MRGQEFGVAQEVGGHTVGDDPPAREDHRALGQLGRERQVVRGDEHRALDALQQLEQLAARTRADGSSSISSAGCICEHRGDRPPAALAHRAGTARVGGGGHPHCVERLEHARLRHGAVEFMFSGPKATSSRTGA